MDLCIVSGGGDKRRHGKTVAIDDDSCAIFVRLEFIELLDEFGKKV